ncbi:MAG: DUF2207 family protein [Candidatus Woesearchaeota archaeon]
MKRKYFIILFLFIFVFIFTNSINAQNYKISNYDLVIEVSEKGEFLITEKISYDFLEGEFSRGYRDITDSGLKHLEFISLSGVYTNIKDKKVVEDEDGLKIDWTYPETSDSAEFVLEYKAKQALKSNDNKNVIDFTVIDDKREKAFHDIDINIKFPDKVSGVIVKSKGDLVEKNDKEININYDYLDTNESYDLYVEFDKIVDTDYAPIRSPYFYPSIIGLILGIITIIYSLFRGIKTNSSTIKSAINLNNLDFIELGSLYYSKSKKKRRGIIAALLSLAQRGNLKLINKITKNNTNSHKSNLLVKILSKNGLSENEKVLLEVLEENNNLREVLKKQSYINKVINPTLNNLKEKGLINKKGGTDRLVTIFVASSFLVIAFIAFVLSIFMEIPFLIGIAIFLLLFSISRFISSFFISILTSEGMALSEKIDEFLNNKSKNFIEEKNNLVQEFFDELPYLILEEKFEKKYEKYLSKLSEKKNTKKPSWIIYDFSEIDKNNYDLNINNLILDILKNSIYSKNDTKTESKTTKKTNKKAVRD